MLIIKLKCYIPTYNWYIIDILSLNISNFYGIIQSKDNEKRNYQMKKLLTSLATITLIGGSVVNATAFKQTEQQQNINDPNPKGNWMTSNEDAEDIASKLFHKTIKLDPNTWLGKNLAADQAAVNTTIVQQGILTADEVQYVTWNSLQINVAGWYWNEGFTVKKDGATATGSVAINAATGETTAQIAAKLSKATLQFNYDWWNGKSLKDNWAQISQIITNEHILTKAETSVVTGVAEPDISDTIDHIGQLEIQVHVNDGNTDSIATPTLNVVNDGRSANEIANTISGGTFYLHGNMQGQYADSSAVTQNFRDYLVDDTKLFTPSFTQADANDINLPHVKLQSDNSNLTANATKDGQTVTSKINLDAHNYPEILTQYSTNSNFGAVVNLTPNVFNAIKKGFLDHSSAYQLGWFYQELDDSDMSSTQQVYFDSKSIPFDCSDEFFKWNNRIINHFGHFGDCGLGIAWVLDALTIRSSDDSKNSKFADALVAKIESLPYNSYLTVFFHCYYAWGAVDDHYTTEYWGFW